MANIPLKTITFPGLDDKYTIPQVDNALTVDGGIADAKKVGDELSDIKADLGDLSQLETTDKSNLVAAINEAAQSDGSGLTDDVKQALYDCISHIGAWTDDHGQDYVDALHDALYPPAELVSISAVYTQIGTVFTNATLDSLKSDLVVTASYADNTTQTITSYTLSGTLAVGASTITVTYEGKTDTFTVNVTQYKNYIAYWDFTKSLVDSVGGLEFTLGNSQSGAAPTRDSSGLHFTAECQIAYCDAFSAKKYNGYAYELDIASSTFAGDTGKHKRLLMTGSSLSFGVMIFRNANELQIYEGTWLSYTAESGQTIPTSMDDLSGKTVRVYMSQSECKLYIDNVLVGKRTVSRSSPDFTGIGIGGNKTGTISDGNQIHDCVITGLRIYDATDEEEL